MSEVPSPTNVEPRTSRGLWKRTRRIGVAVTALFVLFTGWVAWLAQGLEERILREIQPHLATDVHIGGLDVSFWSAWPNVEVQLREVRIADVLAPDQDFLTLDRVDLSVAWMSLLEERLDVQTLTLRSGGVSVSRRETGEGNWVFWKNGETSTPSLSSWQIGRFRLEDVSLTGDWRSAGEGTRWSTQVQSADLQVGDEGEGGLTVAGEVALANLVLESSGSVWLDSVDIRAVALGSVAQGRGAFRMDDVRMNRGLGEVEVDGGLAFGEAGFGLALAAGDVSWRDAEDLLPPVLKAELKDVSGAMGGRGSLDVRVGPDLDVPGDGWTGPKSGHWGAWAVRLGLSGTRLRQGSERVAIQSGVVVAHDDGSTWRARCEGLKASVAGGEVTLDAQVVGEFDRLEVDAEGEGVFRPAGLFAWLADDVELPEGWGVAEGGRVGVQGAFQLKAKGGKVQDLRIANGAHLSVESLRLTDGQVDCAAERVDFQWHGEPWTANFQGVRVPGISEAQIEINQKGGGRGAVDLKVADLEVAPLVDWMALWSKSEWMSGVDGPSGTWSVAAECGPWSFRSIRSDGAKVSAEWDGARWDISSMEAEAMGGSWVAEGQVTSRRADFNGRLAGVDLAEFLEATEGLGQETLLPRHVRGSAWAEGRVGFDFERESGVPWDADLVVRLEGGELIEFDLLQEIPKVLEADRKYRFVADAEDLRRRLKRVKFEPLTTHIELDRDVITLESVQVGTDAMNVGVEGWYRLGGTMDFTLDFALRDLKSSAGKLGEVEEDGLGHRFFLAVGGTMEAPEFGYDRRAHQEHRKEQRQGAWSRLKTVLGPETPSEPEAPLDGEPSPEVVVEVKDSSSAPSLDKPDPPSPSPSPSLDDDDDF